MDTSLAIRVQEIWDYSLGATVKARAQMCVQGPSRECLITWSSLVGAGVLHFWGVLQSASVCANQKLGLKQQLLKSEDKAFSGKNCYKGDFAYFLCAEPWEDSCSECFCTGSRVLWISQIQAPWYTEVGVLEACSFTYNMGCCMCSLNPSLLRESEGGVQPLHSLGRSQNCGILTDFMLLCWVGAFGPYVS